MSRLTEIVTGEDHDYPSQSMALYQLREVERMLGGKRSGNLENPRAYPEYPLHHSAGGWKRKSSLRRKSCGIRPALLGIPATALLIGQIGPTIETSGLAWRKQAPSGVRSGLVRVPARRRSLSGGRRARAAGSATTHANPRPPPVLRPPVRAQTAWPAATHAVQSGSRPPRPLPCRPALRP